LSVTVSVCVTPRPISVDTEAKLEESVSIILLASEIPQPTTQSPEVFSSTVKSVKLSFVIATGFSVLQGIGDCTPSV
jgi:hypothetical protein